MLNNQPPTDDTLSEFALKVAAALDRLAADPVADLSVGDAPFHMSLLCMGKAAADKHAVSLGGFARTIKNLPNMFRGMWYGGAAGARAGGAGVKSVFEAGEAAAGRSQVMRELLENADDPAAIRDAVNSWYKNTKKPLGQMTLGEAIADDPTAAMNELYTALGPKFMKKLRKMPGVPDEIARIADKQSAKELASAGEAAVGAWRPLTYGLGATTVGLGGLAMGQRMSDRQQNHGNLPQIVRYG